MTNKIRKHIVNDILRVQLLVHNLQCLIIEYIYESKA